MMNHVELLNVYEKVAFITTQMLSAAQNGDWELLSSLEETCSLEVSTLRTNEITIILPEAIKEKKISIIKQILADDRAIREITEPWMHQLSMLMQNAQTSRKLSNSYGANQTG
jgi:flagellar protein FliT